MTESGETPTPPLPDPSDPIFEPFWTATKQETIVVPFCASCMISQWPPRPVCRSCRGETFVWKRVAPRGTLYSWLVASRAFHPGFKDDIPYIVGVVELDDRTRMLGRLVDVEASTLTLGRPFAAVFDHINESLALIRWTPVGD